MEQCVPDQWWYLDFGGSTFLIPWYCDPSKQGPWFANNCPSVAGASLSLDAPFVSDLGNEIHDLIIMGGSFAPNGNAIHNSPTTPAHDCIENGGSILCLPQPEQDDCV